MARETKSTRTTAGEKKPRIRAAHGPVAFWTIHRLPNYAEDNDQNGLKEYECDIAASSGWMHELRDRCGPGYYLATGNNEDKRFVTRMLVPVFEDATFTSEPDQVQGEADPSRVRLSRGMRPSDRMLEQVFDQQSKIIEKLSTQQQPDPIEGITRTVKAVEGLDQLRERLSRTPSPPVSQPASNPAPQVESGYQRLSDARTLIELFQLANGRPELTELIREYYGVGGDKGIFEKLIDFADKLIDSDIGKMLGPVLMQRFFSGAPQGQGQLSPFPDRPPQAGQGQTGQGQSRNAQTAFGEIIQHVLSSIKMSASPYDSIELIRSAWLQFPELRQTLGLVLTSPPDQVVDWLANIRLTPDTPPLAPWLKETPAAATWIGGLQQEWRENYEQSDEETDDGEAGENESDARH